MKLVLVFVAFLAFALATFPKPARAGEVKFHAGLGNLTTVTYGYYLNKGPRIFGKKPNAFRLSAYSFKTKRASFFDDRLQACINKADADRIAEYQYCATYSPDSIVLHACLVGADNGYATDIWNCYNPEDN